jgi:hypothetical protein
MTEVDHDHRHLRILTDPLRNHHQEEERHLQIVHLGEHRRPRVSTARHLADSSSPGIVPTTNVDSYTSAALGGVDHPPDAQLHLQLSKRETKITEKAPNLPLRLTFAIYTLRAHVLTEIDASSDTKSQLPPPSLRLRPRLRFHQLLYV